MTRESQQLFRTAFSMVVSRIHAQNPDRFAEAFFYEPCLRNFRAMHGVQDGAISIEALDSRDIVNTLFLSSIAKTSALLQLNFGIDRFELCSGIINFHLPVDASLGCVDVTRPGRSFFTKRLDVTDATSLNTLTRHAA